LTTSQTLIDINFYWIFDLALVEKKFLFGLQKEKKFFLRSSDPNADSAGLFLILKELQLPHVQINNLASLLNANTQNQ